MSDILARLEHVSRTYQKGKERVEVLHELDLEIPEGDFVAVMGPSGSGKTTLLNLLGGLDKPTSGTVTVGGAELSSMSNSQLSNWRSNHVGFIFQFYNLLPVLTAHRNVELPLLLTSFSSKEDLQRKGHAKSRRSVRRAAVARALCRDSTPQQAAASWWILSINSFEGCS